ncbi:MAG: ROK family protein [Pseudonocardiaceae bacterium]
MSKSGGIATGAASAVSGLADPDILSTLLEHIAAGSAVTRADLARATGLARSTVSQRIDALLANGLIVESGTAPSRGGRPALLLRLNPEAGLILSADLGASHAWLAVSDLGGRRLDRTDNDINIDQEPEQVLGWVDRGFNELLVKTGCEAQQVRAIAIGVPGPVEFSAGKVVRPPLMPRWADYPVPAYFEERYPSAQTVVDNDVNLMALGEHRTHYQEVKHLLFVKVGTGIGCGIVIDGKLHRGAEGSAGDIGHIRLPNNDAECRCGKSGCLEAVAGGGALAERLRHLNATTARDVAQLAAEGNLQARQAVRVAAQHIGEVLAAIVSFANPEAIILGGSLARLNETLLAGIRSGIYDRALPLATRSLRIETSALDEDAGTIGAITLAQQRILSPTGVAKLLGAHRFPND